MTTTLDAPAPPPSSPEQESTKRRFPIWQRVLGALIALIVVSSVVGGIASIAAAVNSNKRHCTAGAVSSCQYAGPSSASIQSKAPADESKPLSAWSLNNQITQQASQQGYNLSPSCPSAPAKANYQFLCNATENGQSVHVLVTVLNTNGDWTWKVIDYQTPSYQQPSYTYQAPAPIACPPADPYWGPSPGTPAGCP
jgi:hypothetical protein